MQSYVHSPRLSLEYCQNIVNLYCLPLAFVVISNLHLIKSFYQKWFSCSTFIFPRKGIKINLFSLGLYSWVNTARNKKKINMWEKPQREGIVERRNSALSRTYSFYISTFERKKKIGLAEHIILQLCFWCTGQMLPFLLHSSLRLLYGMRQKVIILSRTTWPKGQGGFTGFSVGNGL